MALRTRSRDTTFGELLAGSGAIASSLVELGLDSPDRIAILSSDHAVVLSAMLGILEAGCVFAPLDASATGDRLERLLAVLSCKAIVVDAGFRTRIPAGSGVPVLELDGARLVDARAASRVVPSRGRDPDAACSIYFTSGSTGAPRAIVGRVSGIDHHIGWELDFLGLDPSVRGAIIHAVSYDACLPDLLVPSCAGGIACAPAGHELADPARLCEWLVEQQITLLHCVPSLFRSLLACRDATRTSLRHVLLAGEVVRPADVRAARAVLGDRVQLVNLYGPTEATLVKLHHEITDADIDGNTVPIGRPMPEVTIHLFDEQNRPVGAGEIGQIAIQSAYGSLGYLDDAELTRARFLDTPAEQIYLTGDYGRLRADGSVEFHGRRDRQIKLCGARVDLDEVEGILCACDGVVESAVVVDEAVLRGFVVLSNGTRIAGVREQAMRRLSPAMRLAWLNQVDAMPRTTSGKIDRKRLAVELEV